METDPRQELERRLLEICGPGGDYDPPKAQRHYVRSTTTGELGWLVTRGGASKVRLDRPQQEVLRAWHPNEWTAEEERRPLSRMHGARVAFAADRELCAQLGLGDLARRDWAKVSELERQRFMTDGPQDRPERSALFKAVQGALAAIVGDKS